MSRERRHDDRRSRVGSSSGSDPVGPGKHTLTEALTQHAGSAAAELQPGKRTLVEQHPVQRKLLQPQAAAGADLHPQVPASLDALFGPLPAGGAQLLQRKAAGDAGDVHGGAAAADVAARGTESSAGPLPHLDQIRRSFAHHDVSGVAAHQGAAASEAAGALGAKAYAFGNSVAFASAPDLHTAAHEAAHVVQQRGGVQLKGGIDQPGDAYEQHADAVADAVVAGESAAPLLDKSPGGGGNGSAVQRAPDAGNRPPVAGGAASIDGGSAITPPMPGIDKAGFIDNSQGSNINTGPVEAGGKPVHARLPPATRVFVSGTHPAAKHWWYVTALLENEMVRGYVQDFRVNTDPPEPLAELHMVTGGDTAEGLAKRKFGQAVTDGHDLRYYENVLLYVNQQRGRVGITGTYQDPGVLSGGANNVQLVAGHMIWLVSAPYAKALQSVVPSGSLTGGAVAKVKRFVGHIEDILRSVTESRHHLDEVAGEYAQTIRDHEAEIIGIVAGFIAAEAASAFLAATPTGVGQAVAVVIQLALTAFGAAGMVQAGVEALKHGSQWLTTAWKAKGDEKQIVAASKEFLKMLVSIAMAALSYLGARANYRNALRIGNSVPLGGLPAMATVGSGQIAGAGARASVMVGPGAGSLGVGGAMMTKAESEGRTDKESAPGPTSETPRSSKEIADDLARRRGELSERAQAARRGDLKAEVDALRDEIEVLQDLAKDGETGLERDLAERGKQLDELSKRVLEAEEKVSAKENPKAVTPASSPRTDPARKFLEGHGAATLKRVELPAGCGVSVDGLLEMPLAQLRKLLAMQPDETLRGALGLSKDVDISKTRDAIKTVVKVVEQAERLMEKL